MGVAVVGVGNASESLLTGGVPDLQLDACPIDDHHFVLLIFL